MIIDKEDLIAQLTDKTGLDQEQIQEQLSQLVQRIRKAADDGKVFEIEGFGKFDLQEGTLQFTPSDTLETEINNKYAGMKPIELIGAFKEPEGDAVPEVDEEEESVEDVWGFDEEELPEEQIPEPEAEAESEETVFDLDLEELEQESAAAEPLEPDEEEAEKKEPVEDGQADRAEAGAADAEEKAEEEFEIFETDQKDAEPLAETTPESTAAASKPEKKEKAPKVASKQSEEVDDPIGRFLMVAVIVLALGIGGWLVYDYGVFSGGNAGSGDVETASPQVPVQQSGEVQQDISEPSEADPENAADNSEPSGQAQVTKQGGHSDANTSREQSQSPYGLRGQINQNIEDGYTIVLHSLRSMRKAEKNRSLLEEEGYRALINQAVVGGTTYYRVGVGQFQTVEAAQKAAQTLPPHYKNDHFIKRIK